MTLSLFVYSLLQWIVRAEKKEGSQLGVSHHATRSHVRRRPWCCKTVCDIGNAETLVTAQISRPRSCPELSFSTSQEVSEELSSYDVYPTSTSLITRQDQINEKRASSVKDPRDAALFHPCRKQEASSGLRNFFAHFKLTLWKILYFLLLS